MVNQALLKQFRHRYPMGSLWAELLTTQDGLYVVRAVITVETIALASGMAAAATIEQAEDRACDRALNALGLDATSHSDAIPYEAIPHKKAGSPEPVPSAKPILPSAAEVSVSVPSLDQSAPPPHGPTAEPATPPSPPSQVSSLEPSQPELPKPGPFQPGPFQPEPFQSGPPKPELPKPEPPKSGPPKSGPPKSGPPKPGPPKPEPPKSGPPKPEPPKPINGPPSSAPSGVTEAAPPLPSAASGMVAADSSSSSGSISQLPDMSGGPVDLSDIMAQTDVELRRLGWSVVQGRDYLEQTYGKRSRHELTDEELLAFLLYLETLPEPARA